MADNSQIIEHYRQILAAGSEMVSVDGLTDRKDLATIQRLLNEALRNDDDAVEAGTYRPVIQGLDLSNSF